jgi:adenylyltransferase/sulfurtransferase
METNHSYDRYQRQVILKNFGAEGQQKLLQAKVLMIGAGGLGCPALQYLAAAGIGTIGIVDDDIVDLSNLQRQVLYSVKDIGLCKAKRAAEILSDLNPGITLISYPERLTATNAFSIVEAFDIIIDGTDNFPSRYMINDLCVLLDKVLVYGAVSQYEGQVAVFNKNINGSRSANYRDIFAVPPGENEVLNCSEGGVLGVLPGIIGTMQANETIKLITGIGDPLINKLLTYNSLNNLVYELEIHASEETHSMIPANRAAFESTPYGELCSAGANSFEIDLSFFNQLISSGNVDVIDIREPGETPVIDEFDHHRIPLPQLDKLASIQSGTIVLVCQTGKRSLQACGQLKNSFGSSKNIYSLRGGIVHWKQLHKTVV